MRASGVSLIPLTAELDTANGRREVFLETFLGTRLVPGVETELPEVLGIHVVPGFAVLGDTLEEREELGGLYGLGLVARRVGTRGVLEPVACLLALEVLEVEEVLIGNLLERVALLELVEELPVVGDLEPMMPVMSLNWMVLSILSGGSYFSVEVPLL